MRGGLGNNIPMDRVNEFFNDDFKGKQMQEYSYMYFNLCTMRYIGSKKVYIIHAESTMSPKDLIL